MDFFEKLPNEVLANIFAVVEVEDLAACLNVSKRWKLLLKETVLNRDSSLFSRVPEINQAFVELIESEQRTKRDVDRARKLLALDELDVNAFVEGLPLISRTIHDGRPEVALLFLERTDLNIILAGRKGNCPIHHAAKAGHGELVLKIVSHPTYVRGEVNGNGNTALHKAVKHSNLDAATTLLRTHDR